MKTLHERLGETVAHHRFVAARLKAGELMDVDQIFEDLEDLLEEPDHEGQLLKEFLAWRAQLGTGPMGGQVRVKIAAVINDIYGAELAPGGVFDE